MSANPSAVKALFKNLVPYADDVSRYIASYGDDAARKATATTRGDFAVRGFTDYADDLGNLASQYGSVLEDLLSSRSGSPIKVLDDSSLSISGKVFHYPTSNSAQDILKGQLLNKQSGMDNPQQFVDTLGNLSKGFNGLPSDSYVRLKNTGRLNLSDLHSVLNGRSQLLGNEQTFPDVNFVGDAISLGNDLKGRRSAPNTILGVGPFDIRQMVLQQPNDHISKVSIRPHKNTALGRWFKEHAPTYRWDNDVF